MSYRGVSATTYVAMENMREKSERPPVMLLLALNTVRLLWTVTRFFTLIAALLWRSLRLQPVGSKLFDSIDWLCSREKIGPYVTAALSIPIAVVVVLRAIHEQSFSSFLASFGGTPSRLEFEYDQLSNPERTIRLIELHPAGPTSFDSEPAPIVTSLKEISLDDCQEHEPFVAISYCWGAPTDTAMIVCDDRVVSISRSLYDALHCLRGPETRLLWADALCINQEDDEEKSFQVGLMRQVYENAESVAVWLGKEAANSDQVLFLSECFGAALCWGPVANTRDYKEAVVQQALFRHLPPLSHGGWSAVGQLLQRPWFGRAWIIQEVAVARDVELFCGTSSTQWTSFSELLSFMLDVGLLESHPDNHVEKAVALVTTRQNYLNNTPDDFLGTILRHRPCQATIAKDKIFALSGLVDLPLRPDYRRSDEDVFTDAATAVVRSASGLDILMVPHATTRTQRMLLPSWVPDWTDIPSCTPLIHRSRHREDGASFQAAGGPEHILVPPRVIEGDGVLEVEGFIVDTIEQASKPVDSLSWGRSISEIIYSDCRFYSTLATWEEVGMPNSNTDYITGENSLDVYWRTLLAGKASEDDVEHSRAMFQNFQQTWSRWRYIFQLPLPTALLYWCCWTVGMFTVFVMYTKHQLFGWEHPTNPNESGEGNQLFKNAIMNRRLVRTQKGYLGLTASGAQDGDQVALIQGCRVPIILRRNAVLDEWRFVGDGYIHGIMFGEAFNASACHTLRIR